MDALETLGTIFEKFPGIGPRQAQRFVQFLLRSSPATRRDLVAAIQQLNTTVQQCSECMRFHAGAKGLCSICLNTERDASLLAVVASDSDFAALERSRTYNGFYFILGGTISLASEKTSGLRLKELLSRIAEKAEKGLSEVIVAFPANPEGDATGVRIREEITPIAKMHSITISTLGRGLSTGSELEYADPDTLKSALDNRK